MKIQAFLTALAALPAMAVLGSGMVSTVSFPEGTSLHTDLIPSELSLSSGVTLRLSAHSSGTLYDDHVVLDHGSIRVGNFSGFTVDTGQLQVDSGEPNAQAVVRLGKERVEVASLGGIVNVTDSAMLTRVASGTRLSFQQNTGVAQTGASPAHKRLPSDQHTMVIIIIVTAAAALAIGLTAAAQGKSPF